LLERVPILHDMGPWKTTVSRVLVVACFHIVSLYIMSVMVVVGGTRYPKYKAPLPDLAFDVLAPYPDLSWLPNTLIYLLLLATLIRCLLSRQGLTIIRRVLFVHAITMLMRSLTLVATSYPDPSLPCVDYMPPSDVNPFWANTLGNADLITCGDLMFSGHTLIYVVLALAWQKYFYVIEKVIFWMFTLVAITTLLVARLHYLNDIIVAMYVVVCVWHVYHMHAESDRRQLNPIVGWLEADIHRRVARERRRQKAAALAAAKLRRKGRSGTGSGAGGGASTVTDYDSDADDRATPSSDVPSAGSIGRIQRFFQSGAEAAEAAATQLRTNSVRRSSSTPHQSSKHRRQPSTDRSFREDDDADEDFMPPQAGSAAPPPSRPFLTVTPAPVAAAVTPTVPLDV
jgi:hypothetical protein